MTGTRPARKLTLVSSPWTHVDTVLYTFKAIYGGGSIAGIVEQIWALWSESTQIFSHTWVRNGNILFVSLVTTELISVIRNLYQNDFHARINYFCLLQPPGTVKYYQTSKITTRHLSAFPNKWVGRNLCLIKLSKVSSLNKRWTSFDRAISRK